MYNTRPSSLVCKAAYALILGATLSALPAYAADPVLDTTTASITPVASVTPTPDPLQTLDPALAASPAPVALPTDVTAAPLIDTAPQGEEPVIIDPALIPPPAE